MIIQRAIIDNRVIVTIDADFHALLALENATSPSVIRIRIKRLRAQTLMVLLQTVIEQCEVDLKHGAMVTVEQASYSFSTLAVNHLRHLRQIYYSEHLYRF